MVALVEGPMAVALADQRERCNALVAQARRTRSDLDVDHLSALLRGPVTALVEACDRVTPGSGGRVLRAVFPPVLDLLVQRRLDDGPHVALLDALPALARPVAEEPRLVVASFANALVHLPAHRCSTSEWVGRVVAAAAEADSATTLAVGQVAAWGVGMAHLRLGALDVARRLAPSVRAAALGVVEPVDDALLDALVTDRWLPPSGTRPATPTTWTVGGFRGFGGPFLARPAAALDPDGADERDDEVVVRAGDGAWRLRADACGATLTRGAPPLRPRRPGDHDVALPPGARPTTVVVTASTEAWTDAASYAVAVRERR